MRQAGGWVGVGGGGSPRRCAHLSEPLQVQDEDVRQRPQAELDAALLQLLAVGAAPGVVGGQLEHTVQVSASTTRPCPAADILAWTGTSPQKVCVHLLLLGVELEALGQRAGLRLVVLLPVAVHTLRIGDVLVLGVSEQAVEDRQPITRLA